MLYLIGRNGLEANVNGIRKAGLRGGQTVITAVIDAATTFSMAKST